MIVSEKRSWIRLIFTLKGSVAPRIWRRVLATTLFSVLVTYLYEHYRVFHVSMTALPFTLVGFAVSIYLGFRNNTSYDRYWEGRQLWGRLVNVSRSFTREATMLLLEPVQPPEPRIEQDLPMLRRDLVYRLIAYVHALRLHLRDQIEIEELRPFLSEDELRALVSQQNRPIALLQDIGCRLREAWRRGALHPYHLPVLEAGLKELTDIQGACERIKHTPIPFSYTTLIHQIVAVYCFALPLGIVDSVGLATPAVVLMVSYAFFGLDAIGEEIEDPFGTHLNDLPLSALSRSIEINLRQLLGETELPAPLQPRGRVLL